MGKVQVKQAHKAFPQFQTDFFCLFINYRFILLYIASGESGWMELQRLFTTNNMQI